MSLFNSIRAKLSAPPIDPHRVTIAQAQAFFDHYDADNDQLIQAITPFLDGVTL